MNDRQADNKKLILETYMFIYQIQKFEIFLILLNNTNICSIGLT